MTFYEGIILILISGVVYSMSEKVAQLKNMIDKSYEDNKEIEKKLEIILRKIKEQENG